MGRDRFAQGLIALAIMGLGATEAAAWCVRGVERWDTLRIRAAPMPDAREVGAMPSNVCGVAVVGACRGAWCPVAWRGQLGWSNSTYLSRGGAFDFLRPPVAVLPPYLLPPPHSPRLAPRLAPRLVTPRGRPVLVRPAPRRVAATSRPTSPPRVVPRSPRRIANAGPQPTVPQAVPPPARALPPAPPPIAAQSTPPPASGPPAPVGVPAAGSAIAAPAPRASAPVPAASEVCVVDIAKGETLKVRAGPGPEQSLRFGYPAGVCGVKVTGSCRDGWCPVEYRGYRGWAEQKNLK